MTIAVVSGGRQETLFAGYILCMYLYIMFLFYFYCFLYIYFIFSGLNSKLCHNDSSDEKCSQMQSGNYLFINDLSLCSKQMPLQPGGAFVCPLLTLSLEAPEKV